MSRMTDTELQRRKAICEVAGIKDIGELSDGFHTFNGLYEQRLILFAALVKAYKDKAWKSYKHEDGEYCFGGGWFVVGIDTPEGSYTYHYENKYFDLFDCEILDYAKHWDGHTEKDVTRLLSLLSAQPELGENSPSEQPKMNELWIKTGETCTDAISRQAAIAIADKLKDDLPDDDQIAGAVMAHNEGIAEYQTALSLLPSVQPEPLSDAYMKAVWTWLVSYQIRVAELKGSYAPYEVLSWVANDWRKEHGLNQQTGGD